MQIVNELSEQGRIAAMVLIMVATLCIYQPLIKPETGTGRDRENVAGLKRSETLSILGNALAVSGNNPPIEPPDSIENKNWFLIV